MSDLSARKSPIITIEPDAPSKNLDATKDKYLAVKSGKITLGSAPIPKDKLNEISIREGASLTKLRISAPKDIIKSENIKIERALKPDTFTNKNREEGRFAELPKLETAKSEPEEEKRVIPKLSETPISPTSPKKITSYFSDDITSTITPQKVVEEEVIKEASLLPDLSTCRLSNVIGAALTFIWFVVSIFYAQLYMGLGTILSQQPHIIGGFLAGILAPVALLWMIIAHIQRGDDVRQYAIALRDELKSLSFSSSSNLNNNIKKSTQDIDITEESKSAVHSIHKARAGLRHEIKHLNNISEKTSEQLEKLNATLTERASKLLDMTQEIEKRTSSLEKVSVAKFASLPSVSQQDVSAILAKTDGLTEKMDARIQSLNSVLGKMEGTLGNIESKGASTADKLSKAVQESTSSVGMLENIIAKTIDKLTKSTTEAKTQTESLIEKSSEKVLELNKAGERTSEHITSVLNMIDTSRDKIESTSKSMDDVAQKAAKAAEDQSLSITKSQEALAKRIDEMQMQISEPLSAVNRAVDKAVSKHGEMSQELDKRILELNEASDKAVEKTNSIREGLRSQTQEMSTLMGQIAGHSRSVKTMLKDENDNLAENVKSALEKVSTVGTALRGEADKLNGVTLSAEERMAKVTQALSEQCMSVVKDTGNVIGDFKDIEELIRDNVKTLLSQSVEAKTALGQVATEIKDSAETVEPIYKKATIQINETQERFDKMAVGFEEKTSSNINKLKSFEAIFDERLKALSSSAEDASTILERSSTNLGERVSDIDNATFNAQKKLQDIDSLFKNHVSDIHLTTDQALLKIDTVQKAMNTHFQDLSASVAESLAQMKDVGEQFVKQTESVQKLSSGAVDGLDKAGNTANEKIKNLNKLAQVTAEQMEAMLNKVQNEAQLLLSTSSKTLEQMKKTGVDFSERAKLVEEQMKNSVTSTKKYGEELDKQVGKVSKTSQRSAEDIEKAMSLLAQKLLDVKQVSKDVTDEVVSNRNKLSSETEHLADVSLKASRVVEEAASSYVRQSKALSNATAEAASHIEKVREGEWRVQRDSFLNGTRFVLESLHSLSVDLTRMVDGDIQEKVWKAYQKGDIAAFTKRLLDNKEKLPHDKMVDKYANDNEFRTYVNRFIRQFEDIYEQANANDYGELISATFASSDVGGLYDILTGVAGRQSLIKKLNKRAA